MKPEANTSPAAWHHQTAVVDEGAQVGVGTRIWHFAHVCSGAVIGCNCMLGQNTYVAPTAILGDGCKVQNNVSIFDGVRLADNVFVGPSAVFTNVMNPRAFVSRRDEYRDTPVGTGATIGANATVVCGNSIGAYALIGAGAVVTHPVPSHALILGVPGRQVGWVCACGETLQPQADKGLKGHHTCPACTATYHARHNTGALVLEQIQAP